MLARLERLFTALQYTESDSPAALTGVDSCSKFVGQSNHWLPSQ